MTARIRKRTGQFFRMLRFKTQVKSVTDTSSTILGEAVARATPAPIASRIRGISDRSMAWLFIAPAIALLLAVNIFPLIWAVYLSFTNFRANRPNAALSKALA